MIFKAAKAPIFNRGVPSDEFLSGIVGTIGAMPEGIFLPDLEADVYGKAAAELGPYEGVLHRRACMCDFLLVLGMFESGGDHTEGVDTSRLGVDTPENEEAGAWQTSYDSRHLHPDLANMLREYRSPKVPEGILNGIVFQRVMKFDPDFSTRYAATLLSHNGMHNGPLYKGAERAKIRKSLRGPEQTIYPYLKRQAVTEFLAVLIS